MDTNATWTTDQGHEIRVAAAEPEKGFAIVTNGVTWAIVSETQLTRDRERVAPVENPETGEKVYPWTDEDGNPVDKNGYVTKE